MDVLPKLALDDVFYKYNLYHSLCTSHQAFVVLSSKACL